MNDINWKACDVRIYRLEEDLRFFLDKACSTINFEKRILNLYIKLARMLWNRLDNDLQSYLLLAEQHIKTGMFPERLVGLDEKLGEMARALARFESENDLNSDKPFILFLLKSCVQKNFMINLDSDLDPLSWMVAVGARYDEIEKAVRDVFPELSELGVLRYPSDIE